jgi:signal transduction histidine kinase
MVAYAGNPNAVSRRIRQLARRMLAGTCVDHRLASDVAGVTIDRARGRAALIISRESASGADDALLLDAAIPVFAAALERADSVVHPPPAKRGGDGGPGQTGAADRRLARIRFDLHDGPQQDVLLLAEDLRLFRSQLVSVLGGQDKGDRLLGRIDDLEARLIALDGDLRRISVSAESPFLHGETVEAALAQITDAFTERTGIEPDVRLLGDFRGLTDSQHITLLGLIREALSNIREHGDASTVTITLAASAAGVQATVTDDGRGFDPETTLVEAARHGHLGLVGMHERVRMLGGDTTIDSRPGGPTVISASLPPAPSTAPRHSRY